MAEETRRPRGRPRKRKYPVSPQHEHYKNVVHERIVIVDGRPFYEKWLYVNTNFPCGVCNRPDDVVFMRTTPLNLVTRSCTYCGFTEIVHPINFDTKEPLAHLIAEERRQVSVEEAWRFVRGWGQGKFPPMGLSKAGRRRRKMPLPEDIELPEEA